MGGMTGSGGPNVGSGSGSRSNTSGKRCSTSSGGAEAVVLVRRGRTAAGKSAGSGTLRTVAATRTTPWADRRAARALLPSSTCAEAPESRSRPATSANTASTKRARLSRHGGYGGVHAVAG